MFPPKEEPISTALAMIDDDGNYTYSKAVTLTVDIKGITVLICLSNPLARKYRSNWIVLKPAITIPRHQQFRRCSKDFDIGNPSKRGDNIVVQRGT